MRFGFNGQGAHMTPATNATRGWVTGSRVPVPWWVEMWAVDQYAYVLSHTRPIFCLYATEPNPDPDLYAQKAQAIANRHPKAIIETFNEPNSVQFGGGVHPITCRDISIHVRNAVRPETLVIGPSMAPISGWRNYFDQVYPIPGVPPSLHLYPTKADWSAEVDSQIALAKANMGGTGTWHVTECGMGREHYPGATNQAQKTVALYKKLANKGASDCIFHWLMHEYSSEWEDKQRLWAVEDNYSLSPLGAALKAART